MRIVDQYRRLDLSEFGVEILYDSGECDLSSYDARWGLVNPVCL